MTAASTEIIASGLEAAAWEMCASLIRTAYSPNVKERADCSTALVDLQGRTLALATHAPAHLGSTLRLVPAILERFPLEELRPGDAFLANDPYIVGVTHLNDCTLATPIFVDGRPVAFAASVTHHSDVGGRVPGSEAGDSTSIFQEGIRYPPMKLIDAGVPRRDVWELFLLNTRTPHFSDGDLKAQIASNTRGVQRMLALHARYGTAATEAAIAAMLDANERRARSRIAKVLAPGVYQAEDFLDEDGISDRPVRLGVTLTVGHDGLTFDFSRCGPQIASGKNVPYTHLMATVYFCTKAVIDPAMPVNEGLYRAVHVVAPEGSVVNPRAPGGVGSRNLTSMILADAIMQCFGQAAPDLAMAAGGPYQGIILAGPDPIRNRFYVDYENFAGGQGGTAKGDGLDVMQLHMTNTSNLPVEVTELEFPMRVERYELIPDSGGAGRHRGGLGVRRDLRITAPEAVLALRSARQVYPALGLDGGRDGNLGAFLLDPDATPAGPRLPSTASEYGLEDGALLRIVTPGGGGYGDPRARDPEAVARDLRQGKVSTAAARDVYGVVTDEAGRPDLVATAALRAP
ncbi:hydantoinase B/oxoprolinase family protein [Roseococcus sp. SYP-B2431]|uniref:hydantoinase B/oxoprolinase family protein n=1 Tax=Roseococcus sp. SYP-B2431 TaxID=2496640 RepID=UPI00103DC4AA|nr:hydantoinase B/oxoprolinase family protein [Roseococcus sp. SYP-B2431]TCI00223.1 hydantoinase B/oxoprolinase family protein [Roseococcus sp. SYP-B2431]